MLGDRLFKGVLMFLIALVLLAGCSEPKNKTSPVRGVHDDRLVLGTYQSLSGPAAVTSTVGKGADSYFKYVNEVKGGVHGRKINFIMEDDAGEVSRVVAAVRKMVENDQAFALVAGLSPGGTLATIEYLTEKKVPHVSVVATSQVAMPPKKYIFSARPVTYIEGRIMARYALENYNPVRVAIFYEDSNFGEDSKFGILEELKEAGVEVVAQVTYRQEDTEFGTQALMLQDAKPDLVFLGSQFRFTARLLVEAKRIGFEPTWFAGSVNNTNTLIRLANTAAEGVIAPATLPDISSSLKSIETYRQYYSKYYPQEDAYDTLALVGWSAAQITTEALQRAGRDLTVENFIEALESLNKWDEGVAYNVTFTPEQRDAVRAVRFAQVQNGQFVELDDFIEYTK